ncbi:MAG: lysophospholipid acyltransferase family protein [Candidatus Goldbacteria bacterium]|nr:lysophospholipid acyltransferase family protein [Candidatus Goldiibacteriota bacterium]
MYRLLKFTGMLLKNIPRSAGYFFFSALSSVFFILGGIRKQTLKDNLKHITGKVPDNSTLIKNYHNYARYYFDLFKNPSELSKSFDRASFQLLAETVKKHLDSGKSMIITTMHYGNWDLGGAILASYFPGKVTVVVEELSGGAFKWFTETRNGWGMNVIKSTDLKGMLKVLKSGGLLVLVSDRDLEKTGFNPLFFGSKAYIPSGPVKLSLMSGAPILFGVFKRMPSDPLKYSLFWDNTLLNDENLPRTPENEEKITKELVSKFETVLKQDASQWCMLQKVWLE